MLSVSDGIILALPISQKFAMSRRDNLSEGDPSLLACEWYVDDTTCVWAKVQTQRRIVWQKQGLVHKIHSKKTQTGILLRLEIVKAQADMDAKDWNLQSVWLKPSLLKATKISSQYWTHDASDLTTPKVIIGKFLLIQMVTKPSYFQLLSGSSSMKFGKLTNPSRIAARIRWIWMRTKTWCQSRHPGLGWCRRSTPLQHQRVEPLPSRGVRSLARHPGLR